MRKLLSRERYKNISGVHVAATSIFQFIFGEAWKSLPVVLQKHYANRAFSSDVVRMEGVMDVEFSSVARVFSPLMRFFDTLVPYEGRAIPTTVFLCSEPDSTQYRFDRVFHFPGKAPYHFRSRVVLEREGEVVEYMGMGIGWYMHYRYAEGKVRLEHRGYVLKFFGVLIPLPIEWLVGRGYAEEEAIDEDRFRMRMELRHAWFGIIYAYCGEFKVMEKQNA